MLTDIKHQEIKKLLAKNIFPDQKDNEKFLVSLKSAFSLSWDDIALIANEDLGIDRKEGYFRYHYGDIVKAQEDQVSLDDKILELKKERVKLADERIQNNAYIRRLAREDNLKEIALEVVEKMSKKKLLNPLTKIYETEEFENEAILNLCDWHYGIEIDNAFNFYSPDVCRQRVSKLRDKVIQYCTSNKVWNLNVMNLADLIAGRIHLQLRLASRFDVITQITEVSEILAELLSDLSQYFHIDYYSCIDNHSRIEPSKTDSLDLESLCRITDWYLKERLKGNENIDIHENKYGLDIITFKCKNFNILGCHGDKDKQLNVANSISSLTHKHFDLVCMAHRHHFAADEYNESIVISSSSLMGTDDYAKNLRLSAKPSQNLIIVTEDNVTEAIYRILL